MFPPALCLYASHHCVASEIAGLWSSILFYVLVVVVTALHSAIASESSRIEQPAQDLTLTAVCGWGCVYLSLVVGSLCWAMIGLEAVHPVQCAPVQWLGAAIVWVCAVGFIRVHKGESAPPPSVTPRWRPCPVPSSIPSPPQILAATGSHTLAFNLIISSW